MLLFCRQPHPEELAMMENIDFEEKVDIDDLVLPSKPTEMAEIEIKDIKQEPLEDAYHEKGNKFKQKMEENILRLFEELDKEKSEHSTMDFSLRRSLKIRQFVEKIADYGSLERSYESKPFSCKVCDASFFQVHEVREHIKIHDSISEVEDLRNQVKSLKNQVAELEVKLKNDLIRNENVESKQEIPEPKVDQKGTKDILELTADKNQLKEKNNNAMKEKRKFSCGGRGNTLNVKTKRTATTTTTTTTSTKRKCLVCPVCDKKLSGHLSTHISAVHEGKKPFGCDSCGKYFAEKCKLKRHIAAVHEEDKPRKDKENHHCRICRKSFAQSSHVLLHISAVHENNRQYQCTVCQMAFKEKGKLTRHYDVVHEKKKPFKCTSCSRAFGRKDKLKKHEKSCKKSTSSH